MIMMICTKMNDPFRVKILSIIPVPINMLIMVLILNGIFPAEAYAQDKKSQTKNKEVIVTGYAKPSKSGKKSKNEKTDTINYIVDGIIVKSIDDINPDSIASVNVLKEDRTVIVRTKKFAAHTKTVSGNLNFRTNNVNEKIIYILDDKKISQEEMKSIPPATIESVSVYKSDGMIRKYTDEDADGVIVVKSKK